MRFTVSWFHILLYSTEESWHLLDTECYHTESRKHPLSRLLYVYLSILYWWTCCDMHTLICDVILLRHFQLHGVCTDIMFSLDAKPLSPPRNQRGPDAFIKVLHWKNMFSNGKGCVTLLAQPIAQKLFIILYNSSCVFTTQVCVYHKCDRGDFRTWLPWIPYSHNLQSVVLQT